MKMKQIIMKMKQIIINKIKDLEKDIKELNNNIEEYKKREDELSLKSDDLKNKEKIFVIKEIKQEFNKKISFLEDKEKLLVDEYKNIEKEQIKQKFTYNSKLQKEYDDLKINNLNLIQNTNNEKSLKNFFSDDAKKCVIDKNKNIYFSQYNNYFDRNIIKLSGSRSAEEPLKGYKRPIIVGLNNIGDTSFINSTL